MLTEKAVCKALKYLKQYPFYLLVLVIIPKLLLSDTYIPLRLAFPAICKSHFHNNKATSKTWIESEDIHFIKQFEDYLKFIPRVYDADCCKCATCGGFRLVMNNSMDPPTGIGEEDAFALEEMVKCHQNYDAYGRTSSCRDKSDNCEKVCWDGAYFRKWNHKNIGFFKHFLIYCSENSSCSCYWPELNRKAVIINDTVYELLKKLADSELINRSYSENWIAEEINFDYYRGGKFFKGYYYPNSHGMAGSLTTYTFFYSQYHQMLLSIASFIDLNEAYGNSNAIDEIYSTLEDIRSDFLILYNRCLKSHPHPKIYYERGMLKMHSGKTEQALTDIRLLMELASKDEYKDSIVLTSDMYQQEGQAYADLGLYDLAISSLTEAIKLDPNNKEAYFDRATAYFELGNFDLALNDYLISDKAKNLAKPKLKVSQTYKSALLNGLIEGGKESAKEFFPSLWNSTYGITQSLWAFTEHPVDCTTNFCNACYDIGTFTAKYFKELDWNQIEDYVQEIKDLCDKYDNLDDAEKGQLVGRIIGKYGVDIFAGGATIKGVAALKQLKIANQLCNLEAMAVSKAHKKTIVASAVKHSANRENFFKNTKIHWDKQNKHVPGKHNFLQGRGTITMESNQFETLTKKYVGKGQRVEGSFGEAGYVERVEFGKIIGEYAEKVNGEIKYKSTSKGIIKYAKDGTFHVIPSNPEAIIK